MENCFQKWVVYAKYISVLDLTGGNSSENDIWYTAGIERVDQKWTGFADFDCIHFFDCLCGNCSSFVAAHLFAGYETDVYFIPSQGRRDFFGDFLAAFYDSDDCAGRELSGYFDRCVYGICHNCNDLHYLYHDTAHFSGDPIFHLFDECLLLCHCFDSTGVGHELDMGRTLFLRILQPQLLCVLYLAGRSFLYL